MRAYNAQREPQCEQVEYRSRWAPSCFGARIGHVDFILFVSFHLPVVANTNMVSGGIWALLLNTIDLEQTVSRFDNNHVVPMSK